VKATQSNPRYKKIEHAGYTRFILERNPRRYNEYGDELDDSESDQEADEDAADENAYAGIRLEGVFMHMAFRSNIANILSYIRAFVSSEAPLRITSAPDYVTSLLIHCPARHGQKYTGQTATREGESMESEAFE
jgi:hypothetical protein